MRYNERVRTIVPILQDMQSKPKLASTVEQVRKLRVDALYGKKKHFNAAERKDKLRLWLNLPVIVINIALGSLLFSILQAESPLVFKWIAAVLLFLAATLTGVSTFFDHAKQVEGHRRVGNKYIAVVKGCDRLIAYYQDGLVQEAEFKTLWCLPSQSAPGAPHAHPLMLPVDTRDGGHQGQGRLGQCHCYHVPNLRAPRVLARAG